MVCAYNLQRVITVQKLIITTYNVTIRSRKQFKKRLKFQEQKAIVILKLFLILLKSLYSY